MLTNTGRRLGGKLPIVVLIILATVITTVSLPRTASAYVHDFSWAWDWMHGKIGQGPSKPSTGQVETLYIGTGGNKIGTVSSNTNGVLSFPVSAETWFGWDACGWQMGVKDVTVEIKGTKLSQKVKGNFWFPCGDAKIVEKDGYPNFLRVHDRYIGTYTFNVTNLPSGDYKINIIIGGSLYNGADNVSPGYTAETQLKINNPWHINGQSYIGNSGRENGNNSNAKSRVQSENAFTVRPGGTLYFDHDLRNVDKTTMGSNITINVDRQERDLVTGSQLSLTQNPKNAKAKGGPNQIFYVNHNNVSVTQDHVGRKLCQRINWTAKSWNESGMEASKWVCANVPYHYPGCKDKNCTSSNNPDRNQCTFYNNCSSGGSDRETKGNGVTPKTTANKENVEVGSSVTFSYSLSNAGPTKSKTLNYKLYTFVIKGGATLPVNKDTAAAFSPNWTSTGVGCGGRGVNSSGFRDGKCSVVEEGTITTVMPSQTPSGWPHEKTFQITNGSDWLADPGDSICSYMAIDKWSVYNGEDAQTFAASNIKCVKIGKRPQLQINGADSLAYTGFTGSSHAGGWSSRGSYSQYGLLTGNTSGASIANFGSSGYSNLGNATNARRLAYANTNTSALGNAGLKNSRAVSAPSQPNSTRALSSNSINLSDLPTGTQTYVMNSSSSTPLQIRGSLNPNSRITIFTNRTVELKSNIGMASVSSNISQMSNLIVVTTSGDIKVASDVEVVSGTFIATNGSFISCAESTAATGSTDSTLSVSGSCSRKLTINGAVSSLESPKFRRTFGAGNDDGIDQSDPSRASTTSEWINYTPTTWLVPYVNGGTTINGYATTGVSGLPTRY
ncbi:MAG: hypothetical protein Q4C83_01965 [Candidatus Saccharibacteria bacterium]|nr:hypothetical protein [Candidatus Saccharibacteria bacterium]